MAGSAFAGSPPEREDSDPRLRLPNNNKGAVFNGGLVFPEQAHKRRSKPVGKNVPGANLHDAWPACLGGGQHGSEVEIVRQDDVPVRFRPSHDLPVGGPRISHSGPVDGPPAVLL